MIDIGLLLIRVVLGGLILGHGLQKLAGWFDGPGLRAWGEMLDDMGYRRPHGLARLHAVVEVGAGVLLVLGLAMPLAVAATLGVMLNAIVAAHAPNGLWVQNGGYEYPVVLAATVGGLALTGPGAWSLDATLGWDMTTVWSLAGIIAGVLVGAATLLLARARTQPVASTGGPHGAAPAT